MADKKRPVSTGLCQLCGQTFGKAQMTRHLARCAPEHEATAQSGKPRPKLLRLLHLVVESPDLPEYWLHIEAPAPARLSVLDGFLRGIWLECCDHLSLFNIDGVHYLSYPPDSFWSRGERQMNVVMGDVFHAKMKCRHDYDFGTTTTLKIRLAAERMGNGIWNEVRLLARNHPPDRPCAVCGRPSTQVCNQCMYYKDDAWYCEEHLEQHECDDGSGEGEYWMPVVNSPRVGVCGYTG